LLSRPTLLWLAVGLLAGCATSPPARLQPAGLRSWDAGRLDCVPFARALTGVALHGDGYRWWAAAAGRYGRGAAPKVGSILVFRRSRRLPHGHVAVVSRIVSAREILVTEANWEHGRVEIDQPVEDVSPGNRWTEVRVWWPPGAGFGAAHYATFGFITPAVTLDHDAIAATAPRAARLAAREWPGE